MPDRATPLLVTLLALLATGCQWVLPERFAVNAPMLAMLFISPLTGILVVLPISINGIGVKEGGGVNVAHLPAARA